MGMAPPLVTDKDVLPKWEKMRKRQTRIKMVKVPAIYSVGQMVRMSKEKMRLAKGFEQNWAHELFRISKILGRSLRPVYS